MIAAVLGITSPEGGPAYLGHGEDGLVRKHGINQLVPDVVHGDAIRVNHVRFEEPIISAERGQWDEQVQNQGKIRHQRVTIV